MKKVVNHPYEKFLKALMLTKTNDDRRWSGLYFDNISQVFDVWKGMSARSKAKVISDSRWNHYPLISYTSASKKRFGRIVGQIVTATLSKQDSDDIKVLSNSSCGVWAVYMLDNAPSSIRLKMAKRLRSSTDYRIRTRCAKILPVKFLQPMLKDKNYSVRNMAMTRIGIDNCYRTFLPTSLNVDKTKRWWYLSWLNRQAIALAEPEEFAPLIKDAKELDPSVNLNHSGCEALLSALIDRMSPEEALYFMNLKDSGRRITAALEQKLKHT